jgi:exodeoxyribonuclease VII large subunit
MEYRLLEAKSRLQDLRSAPVFAEIPARVQRERGKVDKDLIRLQNVFVGRVQQNGRKLDRLNAKLTPAIVKSRFVRAEADLQILSQKLNAGLQAKLDEAGENLGLAASKLNALSPLGVLSRGYSLTQKANGEVVRNVEQVNVADELKIRLAHGKLNCKVISVQNSSGEKD